MFALSEKRKYILSFVQVIMIFKVRLEFVQLRPARSRVKTKLLELFHVVANSRIRLSRS